MARARELEAARWSSVRRTTHALDGLACSSTAGGDWPVSPLSGKGPEARLHYRVQGGEESLRMVVYGNSNSLFSTGKFGELILEGIQESLLGGRWFTLRYRVDDGDLLEGRGFVVTEPTTEVEFSAPMLRAVKKGTTFFAVGFESRSGEIVYRFGIAESKFDEVRQCGGLDR